MHIFNRGVVAGPKTERPYRTEPNQTEKYRTEKKPKPKRKNRTETEEVRFGSGSGLARTEPNRTGPLNTKRRRFVYVFFFSKQPILNLNTSTYEQPPLSNSFLFSLSQFSLLGRHEPLSLPQAHCSLSPLFSYTAGHSSTADGRPRQLLLKLIYVLLLKLKGNLFYIIYFIS